MGTVDPKIRDTECRVLPIWNFLFDQRDDGDVLFGKQSMMKFHLSAFNFMNAVLPLIIHLTLTHCH